MFPQERFAVPSRLEHAGVPPGVFNVVPAGREVGEHLVGHPDVDTVAFTGSTAAGRRMDTLCGGGIRRVSLELGRKSACIILDDADLDAVLSAVPDDCATTAHRVYNRPGYIRRQSTSSGRRS